MADVSKIKLPSGVTYDIKDDGALPLTGGTVTGPVIFQDTISMDEATIGDLVVNGNASFTNNISVNTINSVAVGSSPKFTDTTYESKAAASGGTAVSLVTTGEKYTWNSKTSNTGTITSVKTTAGTHAAINVTSGAVSFNVPTKTSHLTNDSGFVTTDKKLEIAAVAASGTYYPMVATNSTTAATRQYDNNGFDYFTYDGTATDISSDGQSRLTLGNNKNYSTAKWKQGILRLYGKTAYYVDLKTTDAKPTANRTITIPDATGTLALTSDIPSSAASSTTGISISNHSTGSVTGVQSSTTTASKVTLGTAISVPNVTSVGSASTWTFEEKTIPNVTSAGSASNWVFENITVPVAASAIACDDITSWSAGSGSASLTMAVDSSDSKKLNITFSHTHTAPTLQYTARSIAGVSGSVTASHVKSGGNGTAPTLGTAIKVQSKSGGENGSAPTLGTAKSIPNVTGVSDVTVPIKNTSASTFVTSVTHTVTDNGHTHSIS